MSRVQPAGNRRATVATQLFSERGVEAAARLRAPRVKRELNASVHVLATTGEFPHCGDNDERSMIAAVASDIAQASLAKKPQVRA
jgi:hypothetical protein